MSKLQFSLVLNLIGGEFVGDFLLANQAPAAHRVDSGLHWINFSSVNNAMGLPTTYPLESELMDFVIHKLVNNRG